MEFEDEAEPSREPIVRSPGQMMEEARNNKDQSIGPVPLHKKQFDGKLARLGVGQFVAYCNSHPKLKKCKVGKVMTLPRPENLIIVHRYRPRADGRLRVRWLPAFTVGGTKFSVKEKCRQRRMSRPDKSCQSWNCTTAWSAMPRPGSSIMQDGDMMRQSSL